MGSQPGEGNLNRSTAGKRRQPGQDWRRGCCELRAPKARPPKFAGRSSATKGSGEAGQEAAAPGLWVDGEVPSRKRGRGENGLRTGDRAKVPGREHRAGGQMLGPRPRGHTHLGDPASPRLGAGSALLPCSAFWASRRPEVPLATAHSHATYSLSPRHRLPRKARAPSGRTEGLKGRAGGQRAESRVSAAWRAGLTADSRTRSPLSAAGPGEQHSGRCSPEVELWSGTPELYFTLIPPNLYGLYSVMPSSLL